LDDDVDVDAARVEVDAEDIFTSPMMLTQLPTATRSWFKSARIVDMSTTTSLPLTMLLLLLLRLLSSLVLDVVADDSDDDVVAGNLVLSISCAREFRYSCTQPRKRILLPADCEETCERRTRVVGRGRKEEGSVVVDIACLLEQEKDSILFNLHTMLVDSKIWKGF
jgi:hypothetical protein